MASSGTVSLSIDFKYKPPRGREEAMIAGRSQIKSTATIEAGDLELRTIKNFIATPFFLQKDFKGDVGVLFGSVTVSGSLMNSIYLRTLKGSCGSPLGTVNVGTVPAGSMQMSFVAIGA